MSCTTLPPKRRLLGSAFVVRLRLGAMLTATTLDVQDGELVGLGNLALPLCPDIQLRFIVNLLSRAVVLCLRQGMIELLRGRDILATLRPSESANNFRPGRVPALLLESV